MRYEKFTSAASKVAQDEHDLKTLRRDNTTLTVLLIAVVLFAATLTGYLTHDRNQSEAGWQRTFERQDSIIQSCKATVAGIDSMRTIYPVMTPKIKREIERTYNYFHGTVEHVDQEEMR